jgi:hypothetical protein
VERGSWADLAFASKGVDELAFDDLGVLDARVFQVAIENVGTDQYTAFQYRVCEN